MDRIVAAEVFVRIAERGSMTAAAAALDMSRAMVTRYLAQMEQWAGARLLHRTTRRLSLTEAGEETLARCRRMLEVAAEMASAASASAEEPRGLLRVACAQSLAQDVLASAVADYLRRHPRAAIDLHIDARPVNLVEERIDLAIRITNDLDPNLIARPLGHCDSVVCASPAYLAAHGAPASVQDLALHNCLTYSYFGKSLWQFERGRERVAVPVDDPGQADLYGFLRANYAFYVDHDYRAVLQLLPDDARKPAYSPLAFSRQVLRGMALAELKFIDRAEVLHFVGPPGSGKSHLSLALGVEAVKAGRSVYFTTLADLIGALAKAEREGALREKIRFLRRFALLIVDEIGYLPVIPGGGNLFFQLVNARYEKGAMILTSNRGFAEWGEVFGDPVVATALLDRLLHHAIVIQIEGSSYRLRQHAELLPEHIRSKSLIQPPPVPAPSKRRGRPPKHGGGDHING